MSKHSLLLVDGDTRSLRVLEVSLRKAGFTVTSAQSVQDALDKLELGAPDLIISETTFPDGDGFELRRRVRASADWAEIPFVFLTAEAAIENKIRGLELGVDDYLTKPIYIKEIVARINILLQKRQRARFEERRDGRMRFAGRVADMPVVDVIQTIEISRKSGVIQFTGEHGRQGAIYFRDGKVIDAEAGSLQGEDAVYRLLTWGDGDFEVVFRTVRRRDAISTSSQGLLMEGMRRLDEWSRLLEQLPQLTHRFEIDTGELATRLGEVPDDNNPILRLIDGRRSLLEVIDSCDFGDLESLQAISRLYFEGLLIDLDHGQPASTKRDTGKALQAVVMDEPRAASERRIRVSSEMAIPKIDELDAAEAEEADEDEDGQPVSEADEIGSEPDPSSPLEEQPTPISIPRTETPPGELFGGYRPSSLRLIEEAVMAAEAVEPSDATVLPNASEIMQVAQRIAREAAERALDIDEDVSVPQTIEADEPSDGEIAAEIPTEISGEISIPRRSTITFKTPESKIEVNDEPPPVEPLSRREGSGLHMIGSLGRDRAEASGELAPITSSTSIPRAETQRELVTILPRRVTRELPIVQAPPESEAKAKPVAASSTPTLPATPAALKPTPEPDRAFPLDAPTPARATTRRIAAASPGGTRRNDGPSVGAIFLLVLAVVLTGLAIYTRVRHGGKSGAKVDAGVPAPPIPPPSTPDAGVSSVRPPAVDAGTPPVDAAEAPAIDAADAPAVVDAAVTVVADAGPAGPPQDPNKAALDLMARAKAALDEGNAKDALDLAKQSLKLHRTARTYLVVAQAQQRLDRTDDALASVGAAIQLAPSFSPAWERKARILRAARRYDDSRAAIEEYLKLDPKGEAAAELSRWLKEPR